LEIEIPRFRAEFEFLQVRSRQTGPIVQKSARGGQTGI
jgi:hypothetical protein